MMCIGLSHAVVNALIALPPDCVFAGVEKRQLGKNHYKMLV